MDLSQERAGVSADEDRHSHRYAVQVSIGVACLKFWCRSKHPSVLSVVSKPPIEGPHVVDGRN